MTVPAESSTTITVSCPSCSEDNELEQDSPVGCTHCDKPITGNKYKAKAPISAFAAFTIGFVGYGVVDRNFLDTNRYPLAMEYAMVDACVNGGVNPLRKELYDSKQEVCLCVVEKTIEDLPYSEFDERKGEFSQILVSRMDECG